MTVEQSIAGAVAAAVEPLVAEVRRLAHEVERLREAAPPPLVDVAEAARRLAVSEATVRRRAASGDLPSRRLGRRLLIDLSRPGNETIERLAREAREGP